MNATVLKIFFAVGTLFLLPTALKAQDLQQEFHNETHDKNDQIRPQYKEIWRIYNSLSPRQRQDFVEKSLRDFKNDNTLDPLPRALSEKELATLKGGTEQRGRALQAFLKDHYSGKKTYLDKM